ncbi:conserved membrane protein of unknown function [Methylacidimicrobium sp. AP8]|uniref:DUF4337 family protein n=1 Tax=Methylacidimicrobium sp. AP8 TaxID=2730359 RepID=UPI0018C13398|nr:DUF4337 family protein [Methylacidimicrobium sp. AP8]CAB4242836.1 conserved membrane protein of unknown function [Methylacidimicrobium sp. AP8]
MDDELLRDQTREIVDDALREAQRAERWLLYLSFSVILMAILATIAGTMAEEEVTKVILLRNEAVLLQNKATDAWGHFQAKAVRGSLYRVADRLKPDPFFAGEASRYEREKAQIQREAQEWERQVEDRLAASERAFDRHHRLRLSTVVLQLATALGSVAALVKRKSAWFLSLAIALGGALIFLWGSW